MVRKRKKDTKANHAMMPVMRPDAGGIDIGATEIFVAVPADRATENVRSFPTFTQDLYSLADWLKQCGVKTVAMESTGVCDYRPEHLFTLRQSLVAYHHYG